MLDFFLFMCYAFFRIRKEVQFLTIMNFLQKLDFLISKYGLNKNTLSQNSEIPYTTIDGWYKKGYENIKLSTLIKLKDFFNTSLEYWVNDEITDPNYGKTNGFDIEYLEMEHIKKYRALDEHGKKMIDMVLVEETARMEKAKKEIPASTSAEIIPLPKSIQSASAGYGDPSDDETAEIVYVYRNNITAKADYIMTVDGKCWYANNPL